MTILTLNQIIFTMFIKYTTQALHLVVCPYILYYQPTRRSRASCRCDAQSRGRSDADASGEEPGLSARHVGIVLEDTARDPPAKLVPRARPIPRAHRNARKRQTVPLSRPPVRPGPGVDVPDRSPGSPAHARISARRERTRSHDALEARHRGRSHVSLAFLSPPPHLSLSRVTRVSGAFRLSSAGLLSRAPPAPPPRPRIRREPRLRRLLRRAGPSSRRLPGSEVRTPPSPQLSALAFACLFVLRACQLGCASGWVFEP
jgi:hypothetical protein